MTVEIEIETETTKTRRATIDRSAFIEILRRCPGFGGISDDAKVWVLVPSGGDYSDCALDLDEAPVKIKWQETEKS